MKIACWVRYPRFRRNVKSSVCTCLVRLRRWQCFQHTPMELWRKPSTTFISNCTLKRSTASSNCDTIFRTLQRLAAGFFKRVSQTLRPVLKCTSDMASEKDSSHTPRLLLASFVFVFFSGRSGKGVSCTNRIFFFFAAVSCFIGTASCDCLTIDRTLIIRSGLHEADKGHELHNLNHCKN